VWQGDGEAAAAIIAGGLHSSGIKAQVQGLHPFGVAGQPFTRNTWAVCVPSSKAEAARHLLHQRGESHHIVSGTDDFSSEQVATLKFVVAGLFAVAVAALVIALTR